MTRDLDTEVYQIKDSVGMLIVNDKAAFAYKKVRKNLNTDPVYISYWVVSDTGYVYNIRLKNTKWTISAKNKEEMQAFFDAVLSV